MNIVSKCFIRVCLTARIQLIKLFFRRRFRVGKRIRANASFTVFCSKTGLISIGDDVFFNNNCSLSCRGNISIGSHVMFGENVKIYDHNHVFLRKTIPFCKQGYSVGEVRIGNNCWFGSNVVLLKGAVIGDNCVIGAGCIINCNIPSNSLVRANSGIRVEEIRFSDEETIVQ